jgi:hypothetical protein
VEIFVTFLTWIGYIFAVIGFAATVYKSAQAPGMAQHAHVRLEGR